MRRLLLALAVSGAALTAAPAATANPYCDDVGPVPGFGPVCTVRCAVSGNLSCLFHD